MSNPYYNRQTECNPGELADGLAIEAEFDSLQRAFDKLPAPHRDGGGFEGAVKVGPAISDEHAVPKAQLTEALGTVLSKSGNLAGLTDKPTARNNLSLGDAATKNVGVAAGSVAAGDHIHETLISVGGDPNSYYPVLVSGNGLRTGISINRVVHDGGNWLGSLHIGLRAQGYGWGGDIPYLEYIFSQKWGGGVTIAGCLADVAASGVGHGAYVWLRGGRQYFLNGENVEATVYLSGVTEVNGTSFPVRSTGPLAGQTSGAVLDGPQLFSGPIANNRPYWNGENLPIDFGAFSPTAYGASVTGSPVYTNATGLFYRHGKEVKFELTLQFTTLGGAKGLFCIGGLPFVSRPETDAAVCICAYNGVAEGYAVIGAAVSLSSSRVFLTRKIGTTNNLAGVSCEEIPGAGMMQVSGSYIIA